MNTKENKLRIVQVQKRNTQKNMNTEQRIVSCKHFFKADNDLDKDQCV